MRRAPLVAGLMFLAACGGKDPIAQTIHAVADAAEERDADGVLEHVSSRYTDANGDRAQLEQSLRRYFFAYRSIDITLAHLETTHSASTGTAAFRVVFLGVPQSIGGMDQFLPRSASYDFDATLEQEGGRWKIVTAQWRQLH